MGHDITASISGNCLAELRLGSYDDNKELLYVSLNSKEYFGEASGCGEGQYTVGDIVMAIRTMADYLNMRSVPKQLRFLITILDELEKQCCDYDGTTFIDITFS